MLLFTSFHICIILFVYSFIYACAIKVKSSYTLLKQEMQALKKMKYFCSNLDYIVDLIWQIKNYFGIIILE